MTSKRFLFGMFGIVVVGITLGSQGWLGHKYTDVDVNSGKLRTRIRILGVVVSEHEEATRFFRAVSRNDLQRKPPDYRFAHGTSAGLQKLFGSPMVSGAYGDAVATLDTMMTVFDLHEPLQADESEICARLLDMLQEGDAQAMADFVYEIDHRLSEAE